MIVCQQCRENYAQKKAGLLPERVIYGCDESNENCITNGKLVHAWISADGYFEHLLMISDAILQNDSEVQRKIKEYENMVEKIKKEYLCHCAKNRDQLV